ncbi:amidohydrolase family protein [Streptomyces niveus]|uniref:amidohydrolase family protein n=1 Tax=Streptomyces niveus TaxID=193462 RepID=UPI003866A499|nr:amidohydrolase family protein [Streptomyces niveus]
MEKKIGGSVLLRTWSQSARNGGGSTIGPAHVAGATVIDGSGRDPGDVDVTVENGRITRLGASSTHGERLDAEGLTMTPGLIDAHVRLGLASPIQSHFSFRISDAEIAEGIFATAGATLDAGFTTIRDTGGIDGGVVTAIAKGKVRGPRVLSCAPVRHNLREAFRREASFPQLCMTGGVVGAHGRLTDTQFTVVEQLLYDTAGAGLAESTRDRGRGARQQMAEALAVAKHGAQADLVLWNGNPLEDPELFSDPTKAVLVLRAGQIVKDLR